MSRPTPGEAEGAGATRGPASDPSTRQRQLQPRAPTGPRGRWVTATQVPTVRPAPTRHPPPRWTGCSLSAPAWGPCARGLCRGPGPGRSTFHLAVPSKASHRLRAHHTPAGPSGRRQMASRVPGTGGPQPRPRGGPAGEAPSASAAATSAPPPPQVLVSGDPGAWRPRGRGPPRYGPGRPPTCHRGVPTHFRLPRLRAPLPSQVSEEGFFLRNRHHTVIALKKKTHVNNSSMSSGLREGAQGPRLTRGPSRPHTELPGAPTGSLSPLRPGKEPLYPPSSVCSWEEAGHLSGIPRAGRHVPPAQSSSAFCTPRRTGSV